MGVIPRGRRGDILSFEVKGHVRYANGLPASQIKIAAFDRDLHSQQPLGETVTDASGSYSIEYSTDRLLEPGRGAANMSVKAYDVNSSPVGESEVRYAVRGSQIIDLTVSRGQTRLRSMFLWLIERLRGL